MTAAPATDFDDWLIGTFGRVGAFTMLIVLVEIGETRRPDMVRLFADSGAPWNGAAFSRPTAPAGL